MFAIRVFNQISQKGLDRFSSEFSYTDSPEKPDALLLRSYQLSKDELNDSLKGIARAGAGTNNIPIDACNEKGIVVFNTPGANANSVKELVLAGLLLAVRPIIKGINYVSQLDSSMLPKDLSKKVEQDKKQFKGQELKGKTLGIIGLGAIGSQVSEMGLALGMNVLGYDPALSIDAAWKLPSQIKRADNLEAVLMNADFISLHVPMLEATKHLINEKNITKVKKGSVLLNFARQEIVSDLAIDVSVQENILKYYISDFPVPKYLTHDQVISMPHIGASSIEAEENCACMAVDQISDFLKRGNIINSVNFPNVTLEVTGVCRVAIINRNIPNMLSQILSCFSELNVLDMINKSRNDMAYTLIELSENVSLEKIQYIKQIDGVIDVRLITHVI